MARLERLADGIRLRLDPEEVGALTSLADGLADRLAGVSGGPDAELLDRLAPAASRSDPAVDAELRRMLRDDLIDARVVRLRALSSSLRTSTVSAGAEGFDRTLGRDDAMQMVEVLNDLRIAVGASIGYEALERGGIGPDDHRADAARLMDALAWLQGGLIDYVDRD